MRQPVRSPQTPNCSMAAARKVSPAANRTERPSSIICFASFPMVVVLPVPFTPTTNTICGEPPSIFSGSATGSKIAAISSASNPRTSSASTSRSMRRSASCPASRAAVAGPRSAVIKTSASSSIASASRRRRVKTPAIPSTRRDEDFARPDLSRESQPLLMRHLAARWSLEACRSRRHR